jgi:hypothetical protein
MIFVRILLFSLLTSTQFSVIMKPSFYLSSLIALLLLSVTSFSQNGPYGNNVLTERPNTPINSMINGYIEVLPASYASNPGKRYPVLIFIEGQGQFGDGGPTELKRLSGTNEGMLPDIIRQGLFPNSYTVNGTTWEFIVIVPQFRRQVQTNRPYSQQMGSPTEVNDIINYALQNYRVDVRRVYLSGLSLGGGSTWNYAGETVSYANRVAAIVPFAGASNLNDNPSRTNNIGNSNLPVWTFVNSGDDTYRPLAQQYVDAISAIPAHTEDDLITIYNRAAGDHNSWQQPLQGGNTLEGGNTGGTNYPTNVYSWMLQKSRPSLVQPAFASVNAGSDQMLNLANGSMVLASNGISFNSATATLNGSVMAAAGRSIVSTQWELVDGSGGTITNPNSLSTTVTGLKPGTYTYQLRATDDQQLTTVDNVVVTVNAPTENKYKKIEAEAYSAKNAGSSTPLIEESYLDEGAAAGLGYLSASTWMEYTLSGITPGTYSLYLRYISTYGNPGVQITVDNGTTYNVSLASTGSWTTSNKVDVTLGANSMIRFQSGGDLWNFDYFELGLTSASSVSNQSPVANAGPDQTITLPTNSVTLNGSGNDPDGSVASYSWTQVSGPSSAAIASPSQASTTVNNLVQGTYQFQLKVTDNFGAAGTDAVNVIINANTSIGAGTTTRIEAESYSGMSGIQAESTTDAGGGQDVGYIDSGDWMDYNVNVSASGTYGVNLRVASPNGGQLQIKNSNGTLLATVSIPTTGGWQNWQTVSANISLSAGSQTLRIYSVSTGWNFNWWEIATGGTITPPPTNTITTMEAESYINSYGVQKESTTDLGGGQDVGYIDTGDWMDYNVSVSSAGTYAVNIRVSSPNGGQLQIRNSAGTVLATVSVPVTGGWQNWQTVSTNIALTGGTQTIRIYSASTGWNFNWWEISNSSTSTSTAPPPPPPSSGTIHIEAENYVNMNGVQTENTSDVGGGQNVGYIDTGDWMDYNVNIASAGTYPVNLRVASPNGGQLQIRNSAGAILATVNVPVTGAWQNWQTVTSSITLPVGTQTLRIYASSNGWNINWWEIGASGTTTTSTDTTTNTSSATTRVEAENYSAMSGVQAENTQDVGGGQDVGWIDAGDWMDYSVNVSSAGAYNLNLRVASPSGGQLQIRNSSGSVLATVNIPATGGYQSWQTISSSVSLAAGSQTIRVYASSSGWNLNWMEISGAGSSTTNTSSGGTTHIEAENYANMNGVAKENTTDIGGGQDVGYIDNGDWMDYNVNVSASGTYAVNLRLASPNGGQLQIKNSNGTVLATVNAPATGGWQNWQTVSANISLSAGSQTLRVYCTSTGWNFNWWEISGGSGTVSAASVSKAEVVSSTTLAAAAALSVFPNPIVDKFQLQVNNDLTGSVSVQIYDMQGSLQKQFALSKPDVESSQFYLSIGQLPTATYVIKVTMKDWTDSKQIIKQ